MNVLPGDTVEVLYLVATVCFILALKGLASPRTARRGNVLGASGAAVALLGALLAESDRPMRHVPWIVLGILLGTAVALPVARRVPMTKMPQLVALFNGGGAGAAAVVALLELLNLATDGERANRVAIAVTVLVGAVSFSGSLVTFLRLQEIMPPRSVVLPGAAPLMIVGLAVALGLGGGLYATANLTIGLLLLVAALILGVMLVLPVAVAGVPVVISLLNAFTGLTVAAGGFALRNTVLLVAGTLVGASGALLARRMAGATGCSVAGVMFGALRSSPAGPSVVEPAVGPARPVTSVSPEDVAILLGYARKVIIVPGYGLALAQAQHSARELAGVLEARGIEVLFGIHPLAGRMPGHMNVLLAEADVPYEALRGIEEINPEFRSADVVLAVGAYDVLNPAAGSDPGAPFYDLPVLEAAEAKQMVFLKRSMRPGFAGIDNALVSGPGAAVLLGDARESLDKVLAALRSL